MKIGAIITLTISLWQTGISVPQVRDAYFRSASSKTNSLTFEQMLDSVKENALPLLVCYKGAAEMLKAKNTANPINKISCFNRGKSLIENAIARDSTNIECRFIRYSIQQNIPGFLNYKMNIVSDKGRIESALDTLTDRNLKSRITAYFNSPKNNTKDN
ncbi:MAG: hypothetical protein ACXVB6_06130 [Mucilaginibacter sp.]